MSDPLFEVKTKALNYVKKIATGNVQRRRLQAVEKRFMNKVRNSIQDDEIVKAWHRLLNDTSDAVRPVDEVDIMIEVERILG